MKTEEKCKHEGTKEPLNFKAKWWQQLPPIDHGQKFKRRGQCREQTVRPRQLLKESKGKSRKRKAKGDQGTGNP